MDCLEELLIKWNCAEVQPLLQGKDKKSWKKRKIKNKLSLKKFEKKFFIEVSNIFLFFKFVQE